MKDQNVSPKAKFRVPSRRTVISAALAALILCVGMNAYHYSLEGARGLYVWHPLLILKMLLYMGLLPLSTAIIGLPLEKLAQKGPMKAMRWLSLVSSVLVGLISVFLLAFLIVVPRTGHIETARLTLINPAKGIIAREDSMPALSRTGSASTTANIAVPATELPLLRLAFSSDPHWGADTANITARADILTSVARSAPDAFFMLGDTVESGNSAVQWILALSDLEALIPNVPVRPLLGNHDALFGGQYLYAKAFWQPSFKSDSGSPYYWRIDAGGATIVAVDLPWGTENFGTRQRTWLEKTLAGADPQKPLIVLSHSYFYASGYDDPVSGSPWYDHWQNIPALVPLFEKYGVDLVISGHNHYQELLSHNGVTYVVVGSMGGNPDPEPSYHSPWSQWIAVGVHGWLEVEVKPERLVLIFRDEQGSERHRAELRY